MTKIDLEPQELDLFMYEGDGFPFRIIVTDKDDEPVNLTGTILAQIKHKRSDEEALTEFNIDLLGAEDGIAVLSLTGEQTRSLITIPGKKFTGVWDAQWTPEGAEPRTLCQGKVECDPDVSN